MCLLADYFNVSVDYILGREKRAKTCVIFCNRREYEKVIKICVGERGLTAQAYINSVLELKQYMEKTPEPVPMVITFSTDEAAPAYANKLEELKNQYGFKLISINTSTEKEFGDVLDICMRNFK